VLCMDRPDAIANSSFLQNGEWLKIGEWSIQCDRGGGLMTATEQSFKISQLTISHSSQPDKTIMQFLPDEGVGGIPINMLQGVMDLSNQFMYKSMDETHPLLVTCRTGFGSSARFILLHELRARIQAFTFKYPSMGKEAIYNAFMAGRSIPEMLKQLALEIQELSTSKAAIDAVEESDIGYIEAMTKNGDKPYKDFILTAIEKASKKI